MNHAKPRKTFREIISGLYISYIPNKRDNLKQIIIKIFFLLSLTVLIISSVYLANYFLAANRQDSIIDDSRELWHSALNNGADSLKPNEDINALMLKENPDYKGWITISNTKVDNPIYQTDNNDFYLNHNQQKKNSAYGALFFDRDNVITETQTDSNLVIYGHNMKNGSMFGTLKKFKSLNFYKDNPTIEFSTLYKRSTYKIYSVFILNASKSDDNGYIYNISRNSFIDEEDFDSWVNEARERSIINTGVDTEYGDNIITLVTCVNDFENARLVIMARETREGEESFVDTSAASVNPAPRYPKRWYDERGIKYPFD